MLGIGELVMGSLFVAWRRCMVALVYGNSLGAKAVQVLARKGMAAPILAGRDIDTTLRELLWQNYMFCIGTMSREGGWFVRESAWLRPSYEVTGNSL